MEAQHVVLLSVVAFTAFTIATVAFLHPRTIREYWKRSCTGRAWKQTFPQALKDEIREFLYTFVNAFAFPRNRALQFAPADRVIAVYRDLYPIKGWPDALELETFALRLEQHYALELPKLWRDNLTLGEIFSRINSPRANG